MAIDRALLIPVTRAHPPNDWELRESLSVCGQICPVLYHRGKLLDGSRRAKILTELREPVKRHDIEERIIAARMLWQIHPRRAWTLFYRRGMRPGELIHLFGCTTADLPRRESVKNRGRKDHAPATESRAVLPRILVPRAAMVDAHAACRAHGTTLTAMIRDYVSELARHK